MRHMTAVIQPAKEVERLDKITCELCGAETRREDYWLDIEHNTNKTEVSMSIGNNWPVGGSGREVIVDICPDCFRGKLLVWVRSQGGQERGREWDY